MTFDTFGFITRLVREPQDTEEELVRKVALAFLVSMAIPIAIVWSTAYLLLGLRLAALSPLWIGAISVLGLIHFVRTKDYRPLLQVELFQVLVLSFALQWVLGGFCASGAVMIWAVLSPLASLLFDSARRARYWFAAYLLLIVVSGVLDGRVAHHAAALPQPLIAASFTMNFFGVSVVFFLVMRYVLQQLKEAKGEADSLLRNIVPAPIVERLKGGETLIADRYEDATVLFADIVDFTPLAASLPPDVVVSMLNDLFSTFDTLADQFGLEKIKTIGDNYMAVAGVPTPRTDHAEAAARMALAMLQVVRVFRTEHVQGLTLRIGVGSGPVLAGVIGKRKFLYDVYGDTVNMASRMQSFGLPGRIQVTEETCIRLSRGFELEARGEVEIKGKGQVQTYWLLGRLSQSGCGRTPRAVSEGSPAGSYQPGQLYGERHGPRQAIPL